MRIGTWISLSTLGRLIFFSFSMISSDCRNNEDHLPKKISILWKDERAIGLSIPFSNFKNIPEDSMADRTVVRLARNPTAIAGNFLLEKEGLIFEPLIPLTRGMQYEVFIEGLPFALIEIPRSKEIPVLLGIFPSRDTLPENLLKIYLQFSKPMSEGHSLDFVYLRNEHGDTLAHTFLLLHPELWNPDRTILTLWLDPGRIKRGLQPNRSLGPPLVSGRKYQLIVSAGWPDQNGNPLQKSYTKEFVASFRDSLSPAPDRWELRLPMAGTIDSLCLYFHEPIDYLLLLNSFRFVDANGMRIFGQLALGKEECSMYFTPQEKWKSGNYTIQIESRLEDLAGNNLNRPFDIDLKNESIVAGTKLFFEKKFKIP
ncbi:MAG: hypothetical protein ACHQET_04320 [Chitinophagales bacterium]